MARIHGTLSNENVESDPLTVSLAESNARCVVSPVYHFRSVWLCWKPQGEVQWHKLKLTSQQMTIRVKQDDEIKILLSLERAHSDVSIFYSLETF